MLAKVLNALTRSLDMAYDYLVGKPEPKKNEATIVHLKKHTRVPPVNKYAEEIAYFKSKLKK